MEAGSTKVIGAILVGEDINIQEVRSPGKGSQAEAEMKAISTIEMAEDGPIGGIGGGQGWEMAIGDNTLDGYCCSVLEQKLFLGGMFLKALKKYIKIKTQIGTISSPTPLPSLLFWTRDFGYVFKGAGEFLALPFLFVQNLFIYGVTAPISRK